MNMDCTLFQKLWSKRAAEWVYPALFVHSVNAVGYSIQETALTYQDMAKFINLLSVTQKRSVDLDSTNGILGESYRSCQKYKTI
jgi:hypothetical protein